MSRYQISFGDEWYYDICEERPRPISHISDADLNGLYDTKLEALDVVITRMERERAVLMGAIRKAKATRRRWLRAPPSSPKGEEQG